MKKQKIVIVNEGQWGWGVEDERSYDNLVEIFTLALRKAEKKSPGTKKIEKIADVRLVGGADDALKMLKNGFGIDCLIFNSRSMISMAREIKKDYPRVKILVFTELIPDNEIVILNKAWVTTTESIQTFVFNG